MNLKEACEQMVNTGMAEWLDENHTFAKLIITDKAEEEIDKAFAEAAVKYQQRREELVRLNIKGLQKTRDLIMRKPY